MKNKTKLIIAALILGIYLFSMISFASALIINSVSMNPSKIAPGENAQVSIIIKNNEDDDIEDVSISLDLTNLPLAPYNSGSQVNFNTIESDKSKTAEFDVIAFNDAKSGIYKIPVAISYKQLDVLKTQQSLISVMINSDPIVEVSVEDGLLLKNQNNKITIKVINKGLADVRFLEMKIGNSNNYDIISASKVYIGDVDSNDFQTAEYSLFFKNTAPSTINLPVNLNYKDISNKEYNQDFNLDLKVYTTEKAQELGLVKKSYTVYIVLAVITIVLIFVLYRVIRNRRRAKAEEY